MSDMTALVKALEPLVSRVRNDVSAKKTSDGVSFTRDRITPASLAKHLNGGPARGVYPIRPGESVVMLATLDLDSHKGETPWPAMVEVAEKIIIELEKSGLYGHAFRSTGGKGIHIYIIWDAPQDAHSVRKFLAAVLGRCGYKDGAKGVSFGQIEIFPKQDSVPADGQGNMFILPLAGESCYLEEMVGYAPTDKEYALQVEWRPSADVPVVQKEIVVHTGNSVASLSIANLRSALAAIPNEGGMKTALDYDTWRNVIYAIHFATGGSEEGFQIAMEFSARSAKHDAKFLRKNVWNHAKDDRDGGITDRTIIAMATERGWVEDVSDEFDIVVVTPEEQEKRLPPFRRDKSGKIEATIDNVAMACARPDICQIVIRLDEFRDEIMFAESGAVGQWQPFSDVHYTDLRIRLEKFGFKAVGRELIRDVVLKIATDNKFDSAIEWINGLKWDGVSRVETFLSKYFTAEDSPYTRSVAMYLWSALAGRVLTPGVKADMVPILVGEQGAKKSTGVAAMVPANDFFAEISFSEKEDDLSRKMRGRLIAEIGELRGLHTKELESIKAFITRTHENWVPKYREFATIYPRRLCFVGTTNQEEFLADQTGNRRWLPVPVGAVNVEAIKRDRLQLWAEGAELYRKHGVIYAQVEIEVKNSGIHERHMLSDPWTEAISRWLSEPDALTGDVPKDQEFILTQDVARHALNIEPKNIDRRIEMRIASVLRQMRYEHRRRRIVGKPTWVFSKAEIDDIPF